MCTCIYFVFVLFHLCIFILFMLLFNFISYVNNSLMSSRPCIILIQNICRILLFVSLLFVHVVTGELKVLIFLCWGPGVA